MRFVEALELEVKGLSGLFRRRGRRLAGRAFQEEVRAARLQEIGDESVANLFAAPGSGKIGRRLLGVYVGGAALDGATKKRARARSLTRSAEAAFRRADQLRKLRL